MDVFPNGKLEDILIIDGDKIRIKFGYQLVPETRKQAADRIYANYINKLSNGDLVFGYDFNPKLPNYLIVVDGILYVGPKNIEFSPSNTEFQKFTELDEFIDEDWKVIEAVERRIIRNMMQD